MKKNDIKHDPVRDFILDLISKIKERWQTVSVLFIGTMVIIPLALNIYNKEATTDYSVCLLSNISDDIVSINKYCNSETVIKTISEKGVSSLGSNTEVFAFIRDMENMSLEDRAAKLSQANLSQISDNLIRAKLYELFGDILKDSNQISESKENYLKAAELSKNDFHLAMLKFKLSQLFFLEKDFKGAQENIRQALGYDFSDPNITKKIKTLKGMVDQAISRD